MVKRDPDDLITAASKNLKKQNIQIMRITLKRGGQHNKLFAKAHSRIARRDLKRKIRQQSAQGQKKQQGKGDNKVWPLLARYKQAVQGKQTKQNRNQRIRLNCQVKVNKGNDFVNSLLRAFRANFFKKKQQQNKKAKPTPSKADPNSKTTLRRQAKNKRNKQRRTKRKQIRKQRVQKQKLLKKQKRQMQVEKQVNIETSVRVAQQA